MSASQAHAAIQTTSLALGTANSGIPSGAPGDYATVTVKWDSDSPDLAQVTFQAINPHTVGSTTYTYAFSGNDALGLSLNPREFDKNKLLSGATLVSIDSLSQVGWAGATSVPTLTQQNPGNLDGFGTFNFVLGSPGGVNEAFTSITFTIQKDVGTWGGAQNVFVGNGSVANTPGIYNAAAHLFVSINGGESAVSTGFVTDNGIFLVPPTGEVPEPLSLAIWGIGLACCGVARLRRRKA